MPATQSAGRPGGRAMVVGSPSGRAGAVSTLRTLGCETHEIDDPYAAMVELSSRPLAYRHLILCLGGLFREELRIVAAVKRRFPNVSIWLAQTDGCAAGIAEAARLGADGLLAEDGLHGFAPSADAPGQPQPQQTADADPEPVLSEPSPGIAEPPLEQSGSEPVLTADELRALLADVPATGGDDQLAGGS